MHTQIAEFETEWLLFEMVHIVVKTIERIVSSILCANRAGKFHSYLYLPSLNTSVQKSKILKKKILRKPKPLVAFKYFVKNRGWDASTMPSTANLPAGGGGMQPSLS